MKLPPGETLHYTSISVGMALTGSAYPMLGKIASMGSLQAVMAGLALAAMLCAAISSAIAELAGRFPSAPGIRTYIMRAYGDVPSLALTYIAIVVVVLVAGMELDIFTQSLWPGAPAWQRLAIAAGILLLIGAVNIAGLETSKTVQALLCAVLVALSLGISGAAALPSQAAAPQALEGGGEFASRVLTVAGLSVFLFMGFEWVTPMGRNRAAYQHMIPAAMPLALYALLAIFAAFAWALMVNYPATALAADRAPQLTLVLRYFPLAGRPLVAVLLVLALVTTLNAGILAVSRLLYVVAREQALPPLLNQVCARISPGGVTYGAIAALLLLGLVSVALQLWLDDTILVGVVCAALYTCLYSAYLLSFLRLRATAPPSAAYRSALPHWLARALAGGLPLLGMATVLTLERGAIQAALAVGGTVALAYWTARRTRAAMAAGAA
jgi:amino acid transporter